jgi:hypothetical protein
MSGPSLRRLLAVVTAILAVLVTLLIGLWLWIWLAFARPWPLPSASEQARARQRAALYLSAWEHNDAQAMLAMMSPSSRQRRLRRFPKYSQGRVELTGEFLRPRMFLGRLLLTICAAPKKKPPWTAGPATFVIYEYQGVKYLLALVRDSKGGQWMLANGPGFDMASLRALRAPPEPTSGATGSAESHN